MVICPTYEVHEVLDACEASATRARGPCAFCTQAGISCLHAFIERPALSFILSLRRFNEGDRYRVRRILRGNLYALCVQREYPRRTAYAFIEDFADSVRMARRQVAHEAWLDEIYELEQLVENQRNRSA
ncbi:hypothetical protein N7532_008676 [Penicillium argentinense]|uniref:Uncharacterized protein n=1 Tax=Penicillium argentinense TaxID=1131581 RepID=A0A9W9EXV5_9EURO|nr:uncharacterized protein N7532_008676 [Penicillium argentinense]KAJ5089992.1 hypothetical protein N7532_008676 [Penicillium argentinense]